MMTLEASLLVTDATDKLEPAGEGELLPNAEFLKWIYLCL